MTAKASRLDWVDTAKGISIILVVMMHSAYGVGEDLNNTGILHYIIGWATPFRMPEFFLISGLFLGQVIGRPWRLFSDRRAIHYLYFYFLWVVLQVLFKVGLGTGDVGEAVRQIAWSVVEPYGVLWFIYMLAVYAMTTKLLVTLKVPNWLGFATAGALMLVQPATGFYTFDHFANYYVYFFAGFAFAPLVFRIVAWAQQHVALTVLALVTYALIEGYLVFAGGSHLLPRGIQMGYAANPFIHLALGFGGSLLVCLTAAMLVMIPWMSWLRWLGEHSIVVYLSFSIPMAASRTIILKTGVLTDTSIVSVLVMSIALVSPLILYWVIQKTGYGRFLFERPAWAHLRGTPGSRTTMAPKVQPAE